MEYERKLTYGIAFLGLSGLSSYNILNFFKILPFDDTLLFGVWLFTSLVSMIFLYTIMQYEIKLDKLTEKGTVKQ